MNNERATHTGPRLDVRTWISNASTPQSRSTANLEISHDYDSEKRWIRGYDAGRRAFTETHLTAARECLEDGHPAEAIAHARTIRTIPWRGGHFSYNIGTVYQAIHPEYDKCVPRGFLAKMQTKDDVSLKDLIHTATQVFDTSPETKQELDAIISSGRATIEGVEVEHWSDALTAFGERGELHAAGISAIELAEASINTHSPRDAIEAFGGAAQLLHGQIDAVKQSPGQPGEHTAEIDTLYQHILDAQSGVLRVFETLEKPNSHEKELLRSAVYDLDDYNAPQERAQRGYQLLAKHSHLRERYFYKREARDITRSIAQTAFRELHPGSVILYDWIRPDRTPKRPSSKLT